MFTTALKSTGLGWGSTTGITFLCRTKLVRCPHQSQNIDLNVVLFLVWSHTRPYWSPIFPISFFCATIVLAFFYKIFQFFAIFDHFCTFFHVFENSLIFSWGKKKQKKELFLDCRIGRVGYARKLHSRFERKDIYAKAERQFGKQS